jgi:hypothetical protein
MKIKKKDPVADFISIGGNREVNNELVDSPDRVAAILGATILDVRLERLLKKFLVDDEKETGALLSSDSSGAPLSSLSARARAAYCLGLISKEELQDISTVREIRNICAHHLFGCDFENPAIKAACDSFRIFSYLLDFPAAVTSRVRFNLAIGVLDGLLDARAAQATRQCAAIRFHGKKGLNKSPEPTPMAVTPPARQEACQP